MLVIFVAPSQIAAGEAKNPRRNLPKAIKRVYIRILLFYIGGTLVIGLLVPSNNPDLNLSTSNAAKSPFVIAIKTAGIKGLPSVINAALLSSASSAASSDLYTCSRAICERQLSSTSRNFSPYMHAFLFSCTDGLSLAGNAPPIFSRTSKKGLPLNAILFCACFGFLAFMGVGGVGSGKVFGWFQNMTAVAGLMTWFGISLTYIRFHKGFKAQGLDRSVLPYSSKLNPYAAYYAVVACPVICFVSFCFLLAFCVSII